MKKSPADHQDLLAFGSFLHRHPYKHFFLNFLIMLGAQGFCRDVCGWVGWEHSTGAHDYLYAVVMSAVFMCVQRQGIARRLDLEAKKVAVEG